VPPDIGVRFPVKRKWRLFRNKKDVIDKIKIARIILGRKPIPLWNDNTECKSP